MSGTVSVNIRINDNGTFKKVEVNAEDLKEAIELVKQESDRLNASIVNWAQAGQAAEKLGSAIGQLENVFGSLSSAYSDHETVEAKLAKAMQNTMNATDEEIQSVKDLCDAQERLGVVDGDVQTAAAQELATYLELSSSLKTIIPVMNDMIAQQYGLESSAEGATQIASMLGKVMNGQTEALSRYGYKFDEAQKEILQFGSESERAAVLAQVVAESVGGMNEELGRTDAGKQKQLEFQLGKVEETLGSIAQKVMPVITVLSQLGTATTGIAQLLASFKALSGAIAGTTIRTKILAAHQKVQAAAQRLLAASGYTAAAGTKALTIATTALYAAMTMGISLAISGLISLLSKLGDNADDAAGDIETVDEVMEAFTQASSDARSAIAMEIVALENMIKKKELASEKVAELNSKYGESFGYYYTAAEWYDVLKAKSQAYCAQIGYEAQARAIASQKAAKELKLQTIEDKAARLKTSGKHQERILLTSWDDENEDYVHTWKYVNTDEYQDLLDSAETIRKEITSLESQFKVCVQNMVDAQEELAASTEGTAQSVSWEKMNLLDLAKVIRDQEEKVKSLVGVNDEQAKSENELLTKMKARENLLRQSIGMESGSDSSYSNLADDIEKYKFTVEKAVLVNQAFKSDKSDELVQLNAMKSGITSLISKYGSESDAIQNLIDDYYALRKAIGERAGMIEIPLPKLEIKGLPEGVKSEKDSGLAPRKQYNIEVEGANKVDAATESIGALSNAMQSLSDIVGEGAAAWMNWGANLLSAIGQAIPAIATLVAARKTEATVNTEAAATGAAASQASIPFVGPILAVAAVASVLAAVANLPKFAKGGIAYGPTLGLFGEYAGAGHNPEVVAPLDRLKSLIGGSAMFEDGVVEFRMDGRYLSGVLHRVQKINRRS